MQGESSGEENVAGIYAAVFRTLKPRTIMPAIRVRFQSSASGTSSVSWQDGALQVSIAELFRPAPDTVQEALAWILLSKLFRKRAPAKQLDRYRRFINRKDVVQQMEAVRRERGRKRMLAPQGKCFDLIKIFEDLNFHYFHGLMARPAIGWSPTSSRTILGHYDTAHHAIVISRLLDEPQVPLYAVEYVMFHEMLHLRFPEQRNGSRRCVHTKEFKNAEEEFPDYQRANDWIRRRLSHR